MDWLAGFKRNAVLLSSRLFTGDGWTLFRFTLQGHVFYLLFGVANILVIG